MRSADAGLVKRLSKLSSTLICDILDDHYDAVRSNKYLMEPQIKPVFPHMRVSGIAKTFNGSLSSTGNGRDPPRKQPRQVGEDALESIEPDDVVVYATNRCRSAACWGELMTTAAAARGGKGLVTDGFARDLNAIRLMRPAFPVFSAGAIPISGKGRFALREFDVPVWCGGVSVTPGDFILGDLDGVVVIPREIAQDVITKSEDRLETEEKVRLAFKKRNRPIAAIMKKYQVG